MAPTWAEATYLLPLWPSCVPHSMAVLFLHRLQVSWPGCQSELLIHKAVDGMQLLLPGHKIV
jgi:hypothetical protein